VSTREFRAIFSESSETPDLLRRVRSESWYDGALLLFEAVVLTRHDSSHMWPESGTETLSVQWIGSLSQATRKAIELHDTIAREAFRAHEAEAMVREVSS
jgi:hypothetical protein